MQSPNERQGEGILPGPSVCERSGWTGPAATRGPRRRREQARACKADGRATRIAGVLLAALVAATPARASAAESEPLITGQQDGAAVPDGGTWWERAGATGDWLGQRTALERAGVEVFGGYAAEAWGNTTGGLQRGAVYTGMLDWGVTVDFEQMAGWRGASAQTTWLWVSGRNASDELVGNLFTVSNLAALSAVRMLEVWFEQRFAGDLLSVRIGQITADSEFAVTEVGRLFINSTFGWPSYLSSNLPDSSPAYPMGALGARIAAHPTEWLGLQSAAYYGDPFAQDFGSSGFDIDVDDVGWLWMNELHLDWRGVAGDTAHPGRAAFGFWLHTDQHPAGEPADLGVYDACHGFYLVLEQRLVREAGVPATPATGGDDDAQGLSWFTRIAYSPSGASALHAYIDTGLAYTGLLPGRDADVVGIGVVWGHVSGSERDAITAEGFVPADAELVIEATYRWQITPWLALQPDLQVVIDPGARRDLGTAVVTGLRTSIRF